jgi:hypothetical protein
VHEPRQHCVLGFELLFRLSSHMYTMQTRLLRRSPPLPLLLPRSSLLGRSRRCCCMRYDCYAGTPLPAGIEADSASGMRYRPFVCVSLDDLTMDKAELTGGAAAAAAQLSQLQNAANGVKVSKGREVKSGKPQFLVFLRSLPFPIALSLYPLSPRLRSPSFPIPLLRPF